MNAIETHGLSKSFRSVRAVRDVSLAVPAGAVYGLVGKNGAGKSTLLKLVAGLTRPDAGTLTVLGRVHAPGEAHPRVGALVEAPAVYGRLDAFENLMNRALVLGLPDPKKACRETLELVGLDAKTAGDGSFRALWPRGSYVDDLSTGQRQRLGVALALLGNPEALLLDEPLTGIGPTGAASLRALLARLNRERGVTVVVSSHVVSHLERICTHDGIMRDGALVRELTAEELSAACATSLTPRTDAAERAVAVLAEELPGLAVRVLPDGALSVAAPGGGEPDRRVLSQTLLAAGIAVTELSSAPPDAFTHKTVRQRPETARWQPPDAFTHKTVRQRPEVARWLPPDGLARSTSRPSPGPAANATPRAPRSCRRAAPPQPPGRSGPCSP